MAAPYITKRTKQPLAGAPVPPAPALGASPHVPGNDFSQQISGSSPVRNKAYFSLYLSGDEKDHSAITLESPQRKALPATLLSAGVPTGVLEPEAHTLLQQQRLQDHLPSIKGFSVPRSIPQADSVGPKAPSVVSASAPAVAPAVAAVAAPADVPKPAPLAQSLSRPSAATVPAAPVGAKAAGTTQRPGTSAGTKRRTEVLLGDLLPALEPKVLLPYTAIPGSTPRRVEIERQKRQFAQCNIQTLLTPEAAVAATDAAATAQNEREKAFENALPLELFDDECDETRTAAEWAQLGSSEPVSAENSSMDSAGPSALLYSYVPIPCRALDAGTQWRNGVAVAFNKITRHWLVQWTDFNAWDIEAGRLDPSTPLLLTALVAEGAAQESSEDAEPSGPASANTAFAWLARINVNFLAESPVRFATRVSRARACRRDAVQRLLLELAVDNMPVDQCPTLDAVVARQIVARATVGLRKASQAPDTAALMREVARDFSRCGARQLMRDALSMQKSGRTNAFEGSALATVAAVDGGFDAHACDLAIHELYDFEARRQAFKLQSVLAQPPAQHTLSRIRCDCAQLQAHSVVAVHFSKTLKLDEFEQAQSVALHTAQHHLRDAWYEAVKRSIRGGLEGAGKGWYNLRETNQEVYAVSKLKRVLTTARFIMQDALRSVALQSMRRLVIMVRRTVATPLEVVDTTSVRVRQDLPKDAAARAAAQDRAAQYAADAEVLQAAMADASGALGLGVLGHHGKAGTTANSEQESNTRLRRPLFALDLVYRDQELVWGTDPKAVIQAVLSVFDRIAQVVQGFADVEPVIMDQLFWSERAVLLPVRAQEPAVQQLRAMLERLLIDSLEPLEAYRAQYAQHLELLRIDLDAFSASYDTPERTVDEIERDATRFAADAERMERSVPTSMPVGLFLVNCEPLRRPLRKDLAKAALEVLFRRTVRLNSAISDAFNEMQSTLRARPTKIEELHELRQYMQRVPELVREQEGRLQQLAHHFELLETHRFEVPNDAVRARWAAIAWPGKVAQTADEVAQSLTTDEQVFARNLTSDQEAFAERLRALQTVVMDFGKFVDLNRVAETFVDVQRVALELKECQALVALFNQREKLFGQAATAYDDVAALVRDFEPYKTLWTTVHDWSKWKGQWLHGPFQEINATDIERSLAGALRSVNKSIKHFAGLPAVLAAATQLQVQMDEFKPNLPLIQTLRNPGMRDRHWAQLSAALGITLQPGAELTLTELLRMNLLEKLDTITKVCDVAGKEFAIESALDKMDADWQSVRVEVASYKDTFLVRIPEEVLRQLDDHLVLAQSMSFSPFKRFFAERLAQWEQRLRTVQEVLEAWLACQRLWLYLEPIFSSEDIAQQLPTEAKRFAGMNRMWRRTMGAARGGPLVVEFCADTKLLDAFHECARVLEAVSRGLSAYLESKRVSFPRFFFLSDDELLQILSQTKDPTAVQPHLRKCFENIAQLEFQPDNLVTAMISAEGERIPMATPFYPAGNVEEWLLKTEAAMRDSMRTRTAEGLSAYHKQPRAQWVLEWPGQVVLAAALTYWTQEVHEALGHAEQAAAGNGGDGSGGAAANSGSGGGLVGAHLRDLHQMQLGQLEGLVTLVRGELPYLARLVLGDLIVIDVHCRDVVRRLMDLRVDNETDFEWISQLRYYWEDEQLRIKIVNANFCSGYEYLGNTGRLVITPLTDRCYLTLSGALHLGMGGAPAGPAGTGKTETVKDLAKALAKQCVVFNCSDQLDYLAMAKFFKGIAASGAWACFDEFNRIDIEVLSVVAQQVATIQKAAAARMTRFVFEGVELPFDPTNGIFITMNPGYAGRTELPDNLKSLFRSVAMMIPNYVMIAEISLFSYGFSDAKTLAEKIVATFKLSSEQLSSQDHYDFGMRAVKAVISSSGNLKRSSEQTSATSEAVIVLRALCDCNLPKFLVDDVPLFRGILSDLFPGVEMPALDYGALTDAISQACAGMRLEAQDSFVAKCIQLYETIQVRHGLMLVGPSGGGKTSSLRVLARALTALAGGSAKGPNGRPFERVAVHTVNPKAVTSGQLYGEFDQQTHEWSDGVFSTLLREDVAAVAEGRTDQRTWLVFDGPVDAVWIESMNTLLDDNKKLCLTSGEIIKMLPSQTIMFEVDVLSFASPATVSRCGMVYLEPDALGIDPLFRVWVATESQEILPELSSVLKDTVSPLFETHVRAAIDYTRTHCREVVPVQAGGLTQSFLRLYSALLRRYSRANANPAEITEDDESRMAQLVEQGRASIGPLFLFALVWSVGATSDNDGRTKFDAWVRTQPALAALLPADASGQSVYDFSFRADQQKWVPWADEMNGFTLDPLRAAPAEALVPTIDSIRHTSVLTTLLSAMNHVLFVGPTGTGKTSTIAAALGAGGALGADTLAVTLYFSARTAANQVQDVIDGKMDKRRKGVFGPPLGKRMVVFIDDLNMPQLDICNAQPPVELLRQWMDHRGWYDRHHVGRFMELVDINFVAAMGPPGGGRNPVTPRFMRHFNIVSLPELGDVSLQHVFGTVLSAYTGGFAAEVRELLDATVKASVHVYKTIRAELLPTPAKTHYTFNLRDLAKVVQGVLCADARLVAAPEDWARLWVHECLRVYSDRLVDSGDRTWFLELVQQTCASTLGQPWNKVMVQEPLLFGDFVGGATAPAAGEARPDAAKTSGRAYQEIKDLRRLLKVGEEFLDEHNNGSSSKPMKLVMFLDATEHLARICRILRQPGGHALLLGVGGSGRQSLTRLAAFVNEYELFQIEVSKSYGANEWREDLKRVLLGCGLDARPTVFLFTDQQVTAESNFEDLNSILNASDVPNLYNAEETDRILTGMRTLATQERGGTASSAPPPNREQLVSMYRGRVKRNLHIVLAMSPLGDAFRNRLRMFPSLVNCCTIDWFGAWPQEALRSVAADAFSDVSSLGSEQVLEGILQVCTAMHDSVQTACIQFRAQLGRHNYVTPKSYLELLGLYKTLLDRKRNELQGLRRRTATGLEKLLNATKDVENLQEELEAMQPMLLQTSQEVEVTMAKIATDKVQAEELKTSVATEEAQASKKAEETKAIADDAQRDLDEALPALEAALESLNSLSKQDIIEVRSMQRPPDGVKLVIEAVCILKGVKPKKIDGDKPGKKIDDYWEPGRALLADPAKFLESLVQFDKENIAEATIAKLKPYIDSPDFQVSVISRVSRAATSICGWCRAMEKYYWVSRTVEPKRARLADARASLEETMAALATLKRRMREVEMNIKEMEKRYQESLVKKDELAAKVAECNVKLARAGRLISGLGGERQRWASTVSDLDVRLTNIVGDSLLAAGALAYLGAFTAEFRAQLLAQWSTLMATLRLPHSPNPSLWDTLGDPVRQREWEAFGLPRDAISRDNALIVFNTRRWPLLIDPQGQANRWIRNMERSVSQAGMDVVKMTDRDLLRTLENALRFGKPVLLENVGERLDPALEPILLRQTFQQGGSTVIKLGDSLIPFHDDFRFYITTKLPNPHYSPELAASITLVNFTLAASGLEDQLLAQVVAHERPDLEQVKTQLVLSNAAMAKELKDIEDKILYLLSSVQGSPVDDERLIDTLAASKETSEVIQAKVADAQTTEAAIDATRSRYLPVAVRARILFFCITELAGVDPMYQYSLGWFMGLFVAAMAAAERSDDMDQRITSINETVTYSLFANVCRSLFERHKLLFSFLVAVRILLDAGRVDAEEYKFLVTGTTPVAGNASGKSGDDAPPSAATPYPAAAADWLSARAWAEIQALSRLAHFRAFDREFVSLLEHYRAIFDSPTPHREPLPGRWDSALSEFQKLLVLRTLRPDRMFPALQSFVANSIGARFIEPPSSDVAAVFKESQACTPLVFVLSPGVDPSSALYKFAEEMRCAKRLTSVSLGQGQGPKAEALIRDGAEKGNWVLLQNCHLAPSWMPTLDRLVDSFVPAKVHRDFRLWLTSMPTPRFPVSLLQNGLKMTMEPPSGIRANLIRTYASITDETLGSCTKAREWKMLLCSLAFFHAVVQERRKFGALGWNIPYEFTDGDLAICMRQLKMFLDEYAQVPFKVLRYTVAEVNYGGRVTDDWDRRLISNLIDDFYTPRALEDGYVFTSAPEYRAVAPGGVQDYRTYFRTLPLDEPTEVFGMHDNANITFAQRETYGLFDLLGQLMPRQNASAGSKTREEQLLDTCQAMQTAIPRPFDLAAVVAKYPMSYTDSMSTVLAQEVVRYNRLLACIHSNLVELIKALRGLVVLSEQLETTSNAVALNQVPAAWAAKAYPSLKPLSAWVTDLVARCDALANWIHHGVPTVFWISGLFFPQAFLTGTLQNYARKYHVSIDLLAFEFKIVDTKWEDITGKPQDGCYIRGLYLEGARWNAARRSLAESRPKELFSEMSVIWLLPKANRKRPESGVYDCPVYKTLTRAGSLSTTGHSTNYVLTVELPSEHPQAHWIKRGVALVCSLAF